MGTNIFWQKLYTPKSTKSQSPNFCLLHQKNPFHIQMWLYKGFGTIVKTFFFFLSSSFLLFHDMEWTTTYHHHNLNATTTAQSKICRKPFLLFFFEVSSKTGQKSYTQSTYMDPILVYMKKFGLDIMNNRALLLFPYTFISLHFTFPTLWFPYTLISLL